MDEDNNKLLWEEMNDTDFDYPWDFPSIGMAADDPCQQTTSLSSSSVVMLDGHQTSQHHQQGTSASLDHILEEEDLGELINDENNHITADPLSSTTTTAAASVGMTAIAGASGGVPQHVPQSVTVPKKKDNTGPILSNLMKDIDDGPLPSTIEDLKVFVHSSLDCQIPIPCDKFASLITTDQVPEKANFRPTNEDESFRLANIITHVANINWGERANTNGNLDFLRLVYDAFIVYWMGSLLYFKQVPFHHESDRGQASVHPPTVSPSDDSCTMSEPDRNTTAKRARRSVDTKLSLKEMLQIKDDSSKFQLHSAISIKGLTLLCGEEEPVLSHKGFRDVENDFKQKLRWNPALMGRIPYTFGYVACGTEFCLYAIHPVNDEVRLTRLSNRVLSLACVEDVLELFCCLVQVARILVRLHSEINAENVPKIGQVWKTMSSAHSRVTIHEQWVEKVLVVSEDRPINWSGKGGLKELYDLIEQDKIYNTVKLLNSFTTTDQDENDIQHILILGPIGYRVEPSKDELHRFMGDVLNALNMMHENRWVHRDVQLSNIVKQMDGSWMLIDLENAIKLEQDGTAEWPIMDLQSDDWALLINDEERWHPAHDIKQVGFMLEGLVAFNDHPKRAEIVDYFKTKAENAQKAMEFWCEPWEVVDDESDDEVIDV